MSKYSVIIALGILALLKFDNKSLPLKYIVLPFFITKLLKSITVPTHKRLDALENPFVLPNTTLPL